MIFKNTLFNKILKRRLPWLFFLLAAAALAVWLPYGLKPEFRGSYESPRGVYRVEYYTASPLQWILNHHMKIPSFVRLYRNNPNEMIAESEVVDMWLNGKLDWLLFPPTNAVQIGNDIVFENIPPECTDCPPLTDREIMP